MQTEEYQDTLEVFQVIFYSYFGSQRQTGGYSDGMLNFLWKTTVRGEEHSQFSHFQDPYGFVTQTHGASVSP